jgi:hypothetical protein
VQVPLDHADADRDSRARARVARAYRFEAVDPLPVVIQDTNYSITGEEPDTVPDGYFDDGSFGTMVDYQVRKIAAHLERYDDDYVPYLFPWYGTVVVPSALGSDVLFQPREEPAVTGAILGRPEEVRRLVPPDPYRDGLMPRVLDCIDYMRLHSDLPVSVTDCQGPFNIALNLLGVETISLWMYDHPTVVHELMDFCTTVLIDWVKVQKQHAGQPLEAGAFPHFTVLPEGFGGVWISDDDCTILSTGLYREFVVPYNSRVFRAFGGGTLHYCGSAPQQLENFLATEGLTGISNWCMGDFAHVFRAQELFEGRIALMLSDYTPLDIRGYFSDLLGGLRRTGLVLCTCPTATIATVGRRTQTHHRDPAAVGAEAWAVIHELLGTPG